MILGGFRSVAIVLAMTVSGAACGEQTTDMVIRVHDLAGQPVANAEVYGMYYGEGSVNRDITNEEGVANLVAPYHVEVDIKINKQGYYETSTKPYNSIGLIDKKSVDKTYLLLKEREPRPLYAMKFRGEIPRVEEKVGFDFEKGEWVSPYGGGRTADVFFEYSGWAKSGDRYNIELEINFPNPMDGLLAINYREAENSELRLPYKAPIEGYEDNKTLFQKEDIDRGVERSNNLRRRVSTFGYFLRTRTESDGTGEMERARYSKIHGDIWFSVNAEGNPWVEFTYYHNPSWNDRNLEFAVGENLFEGLPPEKGIRHP